jgi:hypothetical protein
MPTARPRPQPSHTHIVVAVTGGILTVLATITAGPLGPIIACLTAAIAGACAKPPELTGKKNASNQPTPANEAELRKLTRYQVWHALTLPVLTLGYTSIAPTKKIRLSWLGAVGAALLAFSLPSPALPRPLAITIIGALSAFSLVLGVDHAWRTQRHPMDPCPGVTARDVLDRASTRLWAIIAVSAALPAALLTAASLTPEWQQGTPTPLLSSAAAALGAAVVGACAGADLAVRIDALTAWNQTIQARTKWDARWEIVKTDPAPVLISHQQLTDTIHVDTFEASAVQGGAVNFVGATAAAKITTVLDPGALAAPTYVENVDPSSGQPVPGTTHPLRFKIIQFLDGSLPDITAPDADPSHVEAALEYAMATFCDTYKYGHPTLLSATKVSTQDAPCVWAVRWATTDMSASYKSMRDQGSDAMSQTLNTPVITDASLSVMFSGDLWNESLEFVPDIPQPMRGQRPRWKTVHRYFETLRDTQRWDFRWEQALKMNVPPPRPEFNTQAEGRLASGALIHYLAFITRQGIIPEDYYGLAPKLSTTLAAAPFCAITSFPLTDLQHGVRPTDGIRHPEAIAVMWSAQSVPTSPRNLSPSATRASDPEKWVLTDMVERAFVSSKLPRPQVSEVRPLTLPDARENIWHVTMRLYDGATLESVRLAQTKLASALSVPWLRISKGRREGFIDITMGAIPAKAEIGSQRDQELATSLDWEQAWVDANILGAGGLVPRLLSSGHLPHNDSVQVLDFELPSPVNIQRIRGGIEKLKSATGNLFLDVRQGDKGAGFARILASVTDPMPTMAGYDFTVIDAMAAEGKERIAFATGVEGEPVAWNPRTSAMLGVFGAQGGGKSVTMQSMATGAIINGFDLVIIDPSKSAADFMFAADYSLAIATTITQACGALGLAYREVTRRKRLNSEYGVGNYKDLPDDVRPHRMAIFIDEFTSLMGQEPVERPSDDVEVENERQKIIAVNHDRAKIGTYVGKIAREARSSGVSLILGTQKLTSKMLDNVPGGSDIKTQLARILLGKATPGERQSGLRDAESAPALGESIPPGRGIWEPSDSPAVIIQSWYDPGEQVFLRSQIQTRVAPLPADRRWDLTQFAEHEDGPSVREISENDLVVDLGEESFSLEELGLAPEQAEANAATSIPETPIILDATLETAFIPSENQPPLPPTRPKTRTERMREAWGD